MGELLGDFVIPALLIPPWCRGKPRGSTTSPGGPKPLATLMGNRWVWLLGNRWVRSLGLSHAGRVLLTSYGSPGLVQRVAAT
jgi:hypothetical protein